MPEQGPPAADASVPRNGDRSASPRPPSARHVIGIEKRPCASSARRDHEKVVRRARTLFAGWPWGIAPPRLPRIRTCAIDASGSSGDGFAAHGEGHETDSPPCAPCGPSMARAGIAIRRRCVETLARLGVLGVFPFNGSITRHPLPSTGSPWGRIPLLHRYYGMLRLPIAPPDALRCLRLSVPSAHGRFAPVGAPWSTEGRGFVVPLSPMRLTIEWKRSGLPSSWGTSMHVPCSQTPAGPSRQALRRAGAAFRF